MFIKKFCSLKKFNTFGINVYARYFIEINNLDDLIIFFKSIKKNIPKIFIGDGSNILFLKNYFPGYVIKIGIKGKKIIYEDYKNVIIQAFSGENWSNFVTWTIKNKFFGLENLSFIPGTVGAAPIQNIGAYGSEIKKTLVKVKGYDIINKKIVEISNKKCNFSYRSSIFKKNLKNSFLILSVFFILSKKEKKLNTYIDIKKELKYMNITKPTVQNIRKVIFKIRNKKIPNPKKLGNAGSFFINPIIKKYYFKKLQIKYPDIIGHPISKKKIKLSANYLIEKIGWKGKIIDYVGTYKKQPIILVNYGVYSGMDIYNFSKKINNKINEKFGIYLPIEVNLIY